MYIGKSTVIFPNEENECSMCEHAIIAKKRHYSSGVGEREVVTNYSLYLVGCKKHHRTFEFGCKDLKYKDD